MGQSVHRREQARRQRASSPPRRSRRRRARRLHAAVLLAVALRERDPAGSKVNYDPFKDFAPVSNAAILPMVRRDQAGDSPFNSMQDLIAQAKAKPGELSLRHLRASAARRTSPARCSRTLTGTQDDQRAVQGQRPGARRGDGGPRQLHVLSDGRHRRAGRAEASEGARRRHAASRHPDFPGVPTMARAGLPGFEATAPWVGVLAPAGTPRRVVNRLNEEMRKSLAKPETQRAHEGSSARSPSATRRRSSPRS